MPKYIEKLIKKLDSRIHPKPIGNTRYYAYLTKNDGELVKVTVAVRHYHRPIKELFKDCLNKYFDYVSKQGISNRLYLDYLKACNYLNIDMSIDKNRFPHDFKKWHDIRIDEYHSKKAEEDEKARQELYNKFKLIAEKYTPLQQNGKGVFLCIIAKSPQELIQEGEALHHCVGRMNYDQKVIREETLIFFIRSKENPDTPLVTIEYSLQKRKILQCYAEHNQKPSEDIENYVYKKWLPYANRQLKKIA